MAAAGAPEACEAAAGSLSMPAGSSSPAVSQHLWIPECPCTAPRLLAGSCVLYRSIFPARAPASRSSRTLA